MSLAESHSAEPWIIWAAPITYMTSHWFSACDLAPFATVLHISSGHDAETVSLYSLAY
jgi:cell division inhibitor SulA